MPTKFTKHQKTPTIRMSVTLPEGIESMLRELAVARQEPIAPIVEDAIQALYREEFNDELLNRG